MIKVKASVCIDFRFGIIGLLTFLFLGSCSTEEETSVEGPAQPTNEITADQTTETAPPDVLELVQVGETSAEGIVSIEATVKPGLDAEVELEIVEPADLTFENNMAKESMTITRQGDSIKRRLKIDTSSG